VNDIQMNVSERIKALEATLIELREQLTEVTADLGRTPGNTRLVIQRVSLMKLIMQAQTELDRLRSEIAED
jgi:predicted component of type VI protein secretion system